MEKGDQEGLVRREGICGGAGRQGMDEGPMGASAMMTGCGQCVVVHCCCIRGCQRINDMHRWLAQPLADRNVKGPQRARVGRVSASVC